MTRKPFSWFVRGALRWMVTLAFLSVAQPAGAWSDGALASLALGQPNFSSKSYATTQSMMFAPDGVAVDPTTGAIFVADTYNFRVLRFDHRAEPSNGDPADGVLGQADFTSKAQAAAPSGMNNPIGLAVDSAGRLWVADAMNHRVLRFDAAANKANGAPADGVLGQPDFTSNSAATTQSGLNTPMGVAVDSAGRLWVLDMGNNRVLRFDGAAGKANGANADGVLGQLDFTSSAGDTTQAAFVYPRGIAADNLGHIWVADSVNKRVLRFDGAAGKANGAPADGVLGQPDFTSATPALSQTGMSTPYGVTVDNAGRLWVADNYYNRLLRYDGAAGKANGAPADGVLGQADFTSGAAATSQSRLGFTWGLAADSAGRLWVADAGNNRVLMFQEETAVQIRRGLPSPTHAGDLTFQVSFDKPVSGLRLGNFSLASSGTLSGASVTGFSSTSPSAYTVTVHTGGGDGTLRLDLVDVPGFHLPLHDPLPYTGGEAYLVDRTPPAVPGISTPPKDSSFYDRRPAIGGFAGSVLEDRPVTVKEGGSTLCTAEPSANGTWFCIPTADLGVGHHSLSVTQVDLAGNVSAAGTRSFTILPRLTRLFLPTLLK